MSSRQNRSKQQKAAQPSSQQSIALPKDNPSPSEQPTDPWRQEYLEERKLLLQGLSDSTKSFDQAMLTLAGGALGLSITFIQQIAPQPRFTEVLRYAWLFLGASLLCTLFSFLVSQFAFIRQLNLLDHIYQNQGDHRWYDNLWSPLTIILNLSSIITFLVGIYFLAQFSFQNLP